jgi:hypothetical protein
MLVPQSKSVAEVRAGAGQFHRPEDVELWCEAARRIGLPE